MKEDTEKELLKAIKKLAEKAESGTSALDRMQNSQTVLNYSHAYVMLKNNK